MAAAGPGRAGSPKMWAALGDAAPYWRRLPLPALLPTPCLVVFMDEVRANIARMVARTGGPERWRPHLKTTKLRPVWAELLKAGVRSFKCATVREASVFLDVVRQEGASGVSLLCNHQSPANAERLAAAALPHAASVDVSVLVEAAETAARLPRGLSCWLDLNPSGGPDAAVAEGAFDRTGCPASDLGAISAAVSEAGERFRGVHWYDGHNPPPSSYDALLSLLPALPLAATPFRAPTDVPLVTSGTPTFEGALDHPGLSSRDRAARAAGGSGTHQVSPGTVVFADGRTLEQTAATLGLRPAALVLSAVVSCPAPSVVTCDAGSKSLAAEVGDPCADVVGSPGLLALRPYEEHLPLRWLPSGEGARAAASAMGGQGEVAAEAASGRKPQRGDLLLLCPRHICPTVNLAEEALLVEEGAQPRWVSVEGRAH